MLPDLVFCYSNSAPKFFSIIYYSFYLKVSFLNVLKVNLIPQRNLNFNEHVYLRHARKKYASDVCAFMSKCTHSGACFRSAYYLVANKRAFLVACVFQVLKLGIYRVLASHLKDNNMCDQFLDVTSAKKHLNKKLLFSSFLKFENIYKLIFLYIYTI